MEAEQKELIPRDYQVALLEKCLQENTIIFLPTGAGKTFITIMALKRMGSQLIGNNRKICIILVNTVALVDQHTKYVKQHTPFECAGFSGEMNVDFWSKEIWQREFEKNQVLVMTSEICAGILRGNIFDLNTANLMIFDECHHAVNDHSMRQIMMNFRSLRQPPRVIGLTATLLNGNCKPERVMEEVESLEVTFQSKVATVDGLEVVVGFSTNPQEHLIHYPSPITTGVQNECLSKLRNLLNSVEAINILDQEINEDIKNSNLKPLEPEEGLRKVKNMLKDLMLHMTELGIHGGRLSCLAYNIEIERMKKHCDNDVLFHLFNYIQTIIGHVVLRLEKEMECCRSEKDRFWQFSSKRVLSLIKIFDEFRETSTESLCGLIFVERRFTAKILYHILDNLSKCDSNYSYLRADFIIGNNNNPFNESRENLYISKKNKQCLLRFMDKELNLLCTSQVLEEGIDIPKCTFVCKFDPPKDYRSYIQSKGRARHNRSHYYILIESSKLDKFMASYNQFQVVEGTLNDFLIGKTDHRTGPTNQEVEAMYNENSIPPYYVNGPGSAYVNMVSAIPLLCRYCQSLPADQYTIYSPEWYLEDIRDSIKGLQHVVHLVMPVLCPIRDPIKGYPMRNKKMAKRAAALVACIELHKCGELDDCLLPIKRKVPEVDVMYLFQHHPDVKEVGAGIKLMRTHDLEISNSSLGKLLPGHVSYLHIINVEPLFERYENINNQTMYDMYTSNLSFGIVTPNAMPSTCKFPIYVSGGTVMVSVLNNIREVRLSALDIDLIHEFHLVVFNDVHEVLSSFLILDVTDKAESMFVVPVNKAEMEINFEVMKNNRHVKSREDLMTHAEKMRLEVNDATYLHKIVMPSYRRDKTIYLVTKVCEDKNPESDFPNESYTDFCEYYLEKHQEHIVNRSQPLLFVKPLSQKLNLYKPQGLERKRKKEKNYEQVEEYLIPEMLIKQEFPASLWIQGTFLPTILSRLSYILRVEKLWRQIGEDCEFVLEQKNMRPLQLNMNLLHYDASVDEKELVGQLKKTYDKSEGMLALPSSLKTSVCNKDFQTKVLESKYPWKDLEEPKDINRTLEVSVMDVEAYENFIGQRISGNERKDVHTSPVKSIYPALTYDKKFEEKPIKTLKQKNNGMVELADIYEALTTSKANDIVNLERLETLGDSFLKYIASCYIMLKFPHYDEGRATQLKGRLISNKNLFYVARQHKIGGIMKNRDFTPKGEWLPPGFCIPEQIANAVCQKTISVNCLFRCHFSKEEKLSGAIKDSVLDPIIAEYTSHGEDVNSYQNMDQFLKQQCLKDKCVADAVEALLGTYLQNVGFEGCLKVIHWLGIIPPSENLEAFLKQPPPDPCIKPNAQLRDITFHIPLHNEIEVIIGYKFKNKAYLLQALTHASYSSNRITQSYETLEFLGDAVLDFLVTCFIYESCDKLTPGDLTDLRSALVNNITFASYLVRLGLHKYMLMMNSKLQSRIDKFDEFMTMKNFQIDDEVLILLEEEDMNMAEYIDVPKVLGDIFEALAGAVFLDSGYNLDTVWKVFYKIMWREIDSFSRCIPKNMVRRLFESEGAYPEYGNAQTTQSGRIMIKLHFHAEGRPKYVYGFGSSKILAKKAAAKIALRYL